MSKPQNKLLSKLLKYRCYKESFFLDYLPDEIFMNLEKKDRVEYRKLRENHQIIEKKSSKIKALQEEIRIKQIALQNLKSQIEPSISKDSHLDEMNLSKFKLADIIAKFNFSLSIGQRIHKTKTNKSSQPKFYMRITASDKRFKNLYVGSSKKIIISLANIYHEPYTSFSVEELKSELKLLYSVYVRNFVWNNSWDLFFDSKHTLKDLELWSNEIGSEIYRW